MIKVMLVDDHDIAREGYKLLLEKANIQVAAEARSGEEAYANYGQVSPDIAIVDMSMPGMSGIATIKKIKNKYPEAKLLALSVHDDFIFTSRAIAAGASGYVTKSSAPQFLVEAIKKIEDGGIFISGDLALKILEHKGSDAEIVKKLNDSEFEVLRLMGLGDSLDDISQKLSLSYNTIANIQTHIKRKLEISTREELIMAAIRLKIVKS
jgi:DNA-binding NarL/FixJ family response regulator